LAKLNIVGAGPGSPDYVTPAARKAVQTADIVCGAQRNLNLFRTDIKGKPVVLTAKNMDKELKTAVELAKKGKNVVLVCTGDPGFSGLLKSVMDRDLIKADEVNVVAGVSSLQVCAARLGMSWDNVRLFSFHEGATAEKKEELALTVKAGGTVMLLPEPKAFSPKEIAEYLISEGIDKKTKVWLCENLTLTNEHISMGTLDSLGTKSESLTIMVIKPNSKEKS
jgi:cobalt-precorrin-7 (C5)-methyltransferase